jgi:hypothetical protein
MLRHRVQRPGDFHVIVTVHLDPGEDRLVVWLWQRSQTASLQSANISAGRVAVVPCTRIPAISPHQISTRFWGSARSVKYSPAPKLPRTSCTARSTRGLSCGERIRVGSVANQRCCA